ncbi:TRAP transporter large permease subunit [Roseococcus sp. SDR]|uniref:TRAP transporter large permease n=1 Tax=Roseococcus sp. SDR TaxID=2835532 RepID=UPI001BCF6AC6|nr:TRAP transporter large permease subunit [Roseococcus sp. SDR]MBS7788405.1 TRAP transporter large permease subunit [Roseococcus sp. SDR]MBV1843719.1 TRAP transporter large permease subunit [Roseococcus sp. SDR]
MDDVTLGFTLIGVMVALIVVGLPIGITLISTGAVGVWLIRENPDLAFRFTALATYSGIQDYLFATIPLFVLMGLLVSISDVGKDTFDVAQNLLRRVKGGLGIATVGANAVFAAVTGVSIASAAVFTKVAVPEMVRHGYSMRFAAGTVAGSSILGMLIPPSLLMIVYGVLAEVSIGAMFIAGVIPGIIIALGFVVMIWSYARFAPHRIMTHAESPALKDEPVMGTAEMLGKSVPILALVVLILGGLYTGFFTPTEAGAVGAAGALIIALVRRRLDAKKFWRVLRETGLVSAAILFLLIAAGLYSRMLSMAGVPNAIGDFVEHLGLGPYGFLAAFVIVILLMGMILDSTSILLIMVPIGAPIAQAMGFDLIHFGIITIIAVEMGLLTPPFGISVFTVKATLADPKVGIETIFAGAMPFIAVMGAALVVIALFPVLSTALVR